jgi:demethylmenaquinone methyltransferase/2-methoxy-6-polyprenyl-1,4-benzoquinol methylase
MMSGTNDILNQQIEYYRARAQEYHEWFLRQGRYDRGEDHRKHWQAELAFVESALIKESPQGAVLELACGTGLWTGCLAKRATLVTAVDSSAEVLAINRRKIGSLPVEFVEADIFHWKPSRQYDFIFFGFWLSHIPAERFKTFWDLVASALSTGGKVFFVDSLFNQESTAKDHLTPDHSGVVERKLNDGSKYLIIKKFYEPEELARKLGQPGWEGKILSSGQFFLYGCVKRKDDTPLHKTFGNW